MRNPNLKRAIQARTNQRSHFTTDAPLRPLRRPEPAEGGSRRAVYLAGEALQALGGSRGRRERARVPSTAGSPSRLAERERASPRHWRPRRPLRRALPAEGGSRRAVYLAGEALQALGGSRGRRERARVPSTAGSPSRLAERERASPRHWRPRRPLRRPEPAEGGSRRSAAAAVARRCDRPAVRPNLGFGRDGQGENRQDADVSPEISSD
jgi:hypothetical protein